jgi:hypothetical protein
MLQKLKCLLGLHNNKTEGAYSVKCLKCISCGSYDNGLSIKTADHENSYVLYNGATVRVIITNEKEYMKKLKLTQANIIEDLKNNN